MNSYGLDGPGFELPDGHEVFSSPNLSKHSLDPPSFLFSGYLGPFPGLRRSASEDDHSHSPNSETKNEWSYIFTSHTPS